MNSVHLRKFRPEDLILSNEDTTVVLQFFWPSEPRHSQIKNQLLITDHVRSFAQGLLVEAIDKSYSYGFIDAIFRAAANPTSGTIKILKRFGRRASSNWFRHTKASDLQNIRIYDRVREGIAYTFTGEMDRHIQGVADLRPEVPTSALVARKATDSRNYKVWG